MDRPPEKPSEETAKLVRAVLSSAECRRIPLRGFEDAFQSCTGERLPWQECRYESATEYLEAMPRSVCAIEKLTVVTKAGKTVEDLFVTLRDEKDDGAVSASSASSSDARIRAGSIGGRSACSDVRDSVDSAGMGEARSASALRSTVSLTFSINDNPHLDKL